MDAADRLRAWFEGSGLTRDEAGALIGCHGSLLSKLEKRRQRPGRMVSVLIEKLVGIRQSDWDAVKVITPAPKSRKRRKPVGKSKRGAA